MTHLCRLLPLPPQPCLSRGREVFLHGFIHREWIVLPHAPAAPFPRRLPAHPAHVALPALPHIHIGEPTLRRAELLHNPLYVLCKAREDFRARDVTKDVLTVREEGPLPTGMKV